MQSHTSKAAGHQIVNVKRKCTHCDGTKATRLSQYSWVV